MINDIERVIKHVKAHGIKIGKPLTCGGCAAFVVRSDEYCCILKPFMCDSSGRPLSRCPKPLTQPNFKKVKDLLSSEMP